MTETVRYSFRLRPGAQAKDALCSEWNRCRFLWNEAVRQQQIGRRPTLCRLSKLLTEARGQFSWLREGSQVAQQQTLRTYADALRRSFEVKGRGRPRFKKRRKSLPTLEYTLRGFSIRGGRLRLPNGVSIPIVWSRQLPSAPTSVRVYQDSLGHWYASFVVRRATPKAVVVDGAIGIDWGVKTTATTTNPSYDLPYAGHRRRCAAELGKAQRKMSRRRKPKGQAPSNGFKNAKLQVAKLHKKAKRQNLHTGRIWAKAVVDDHQLIAVEDFRPRFLAKSTMARKAADAAISAAKRDLIDRGQRAGRTVVLVPPAYTTMTCSKCASRNKTRLLLDYRTFLCEHCGHTADRDRNAARVILAKAESNLAGADDASHSLSPPVRVVGLDAV
jgi:putative transposase